jgi:hypothetical protein
VATFLLHTLVQVCLCLMCVRVYVSICLHECCLHAFVCVFFSLSVRDFFFPCTITCILVCVCMLVGVRVGVGCGCVCCVCVCVCVCVVRRKCHKMDGGGCARCYRNSGPISYKSIRLRGRESLVQLEQVLHKRGGGDARTKSNEQKTVRIRKASIRRGFRLIFQ